MSANPSSANPPSVNNNEIQPRIKEGSNLLTALFLLIGVGISLGGAAYFIVRITANPDKAGNGKSPVSTNKQVQVDRKSGKGKEEKSTPGSLDTIVNELS